MRDLVLALGFLTYLPFCFRFPAAGVICWTWLSLMSPHRQVYGFTEGQPFNLVLAIATLSGWLLSNERKRWPTDAVPWLMLAFVAWMSFNSLFSPFPDWSWPYWDRFMRALTLVFLAFFVINSKVRMHALIWIIVISLGYYGVKGGVFTITTGGTNHVLGPPETIISDNNQLAAVIVMTLPLVNYLRLQSRVRIIQLGLSAALGLLVIMVFGSGSRGGILALAASLAVLWFRSRRKLTYMIIAGGVLAFALSMMPDSFWHRMDTINDLQTDESFQGRLIAWQVALRAAIDYFPFGAGFYAPQLSQIFNAYFPGETTHAAHSIYFQVLGEHGFIGLALYLLILLLGLRNSQIIRRQTRNRPELLWAYDMASMLQVAVIGFCIGGAALSMAYYDGFLLLIALLSTLRELTTAQTASAGADAPGRFRFAPAPGAAATRAPAPVWRLRAGHTGAQDN